MNSEHCKGKELPLRAVVSALTAAPFRGARGPGEKQTMPQQQAWLRSKAVGAKNAVTLKLLP